MDVLAGQDKPQTRLARCRPHNVEAVCADGGGRVLLFQEAPPRAELVDLDASQVVASVILRLEGRSQLARSWLSQGFAGPDNPFPWMSEAMDLKKEKNFFETRVIEYQNGGALTWH